MKTLKTLLVALLAFVLYTNVEAQTCYGLDENDFPQTCVSTEGTAPSTATFNHDYVTGSAATGYTGGADGTDDVAVTMTATCNQPNGTNGSTYVAACLGPDGLDSQHNGANAACGGGGLMINVAGGSDFGGATCDDQPCSVCYVEVCYDFINGYSSEAAGFDAVWSSMNGSTEGYEAMVGWVEGTDNTGAPLATNGTTTTGLNSWCHSDVVAGTLPINAIFGAAPPAGTFSADAVTGDGTATVCPNEEPASSSGPNSGGTAAGVAGANLGLNADDIITRMCFVYILSNNNGDDCDANGETSVNTNPSGSLASVDVCPPAVEVNIPCGDCTGSAGGLFITELSYDPATAQGSDADCEYIEIYNGYSNTITMDANTTLDLGNGLTYTFPAGTTIAPGEYIIVAINPTNFGTCTWATPPPAGTQIFGPTSGSLANAGESVDITLACAPDAAAGFTQTVTFSDATTPSAGGGGDAVYYPLDGTGPLAGAPTPGSGDCAGCGNEYMCVAPVACPTTQVVDGTAAAVCALATEITDWKALVEATDGTGAVTAPATAPAVTTIVYSMTAGYSSVDFPSSGWDAEPTGAHSGAGCADETQTTYAYVICDLTGDGETADDVVTAVGSIAVTYFAPAQAPTITNDMTCAYTYVAACTGDVFAPATIPAAAPGEDPAPFDVTVTTANGCMATFTVDPAACPVDMTCSITDLVVTPTACDPATDTYSLDIGFTVTNPGPSGMFNVDVCGTAYGPFSYATDVPLNIPDLPADGTAGCTVTVTDVDGGTLTPATSLYVSFVPDGAGAGGGIDECVGESVTIHNFSTDAAGCVDVDISGYQLQDNNGVFYTFPAGTVVPAGGSLTITIDQVNACSGTVGMGDGGGAQFANGGDNADLLDAAGAPIDATGTINGDPGVEYESPALTAAGGAGSAMCTADACSAAMAYDAPASCMVMCPTDIAGMLGADAVVCSDNTATDLMVAITGGGTGPYTVTYNDGTMDIVITYNDGDAIPVAPTATTTYTLVSITDANGCTGTVSGTALITVNDLPNAGMAGAATACSNAADGNTIVDLDGSLTGTPDAAGVWMETTASGVSLANTMAVDFDGVAPGMYTFTYTVPGAAPCVDATADVVVTVEDCSIPCPAITADIAADATVCADNTASTLTITITGGTGPYTVMYSDGTTQTITGYNSGDAIAVSPTATTTYMLTGVMDANMCPATLGTTDATITVVNLPVAGTSAPAMACNDSTEGVSVVNLDGTLTGADAGGAWSETTASGVSLADPTMVDFSGVAPGTYTFVYTVAATAPCTADATVSVDIMVADCAVPGCTLVLSPETVACDAETAGVDTYTVSIPFDNGAEGAPGMMGYTVTTSGTLGGDNPMTTQSGVITITFTEGVAYDYSIQGTAGNANELCDFTVSGASPMCEPMVCEDEIAGMVIADPSCDLTGITVTITDEMGNVVATLTTDSAGIYDSTPAVFPCGNYFAELTGSIPACYTDTNGETGPKPFVIDGDTPMNDTDGPNFGAIASIPTVGEWGLIILALLMSIVAVVGIRERKASEINA